MLITHFSNVQPLSKETVAELDAADSTQIKSSIKQGLGKYHAASPACQALGPLPKFFLTSSVPLVALAMAGPPVTIWFNSGPGPRPHLLNLLFNLLLHDTCCESCGGFPDYRG